MAVQQTSDGRFYVRQSTRGRGAKALQLALNAALYLFAWALATFVGFFAFSFLLP